MNPRLLHIVVLITILGMLAVACEEGDATTTATSTLATTTTDSPTTTNLATATTTASSALDDLGYPVSDEWVVETVVTEITGGTGGLAIDADGVIYQGDFGSRNRQGRSVLRISPDGQIETFSESPLMRSLTMTTFGADGNMYQSSYGSDRVFVIAEDGTPDLITEGINGPTGIVGLEDGTLFIESYESSRIYRIDADGTLSTFASGSPMNGPNGLTIAPDGTLYGVNHRDGALFSVAGDGVVTELHRFPKATSHLVYHDGSLFITSRLGYVVFRYDLETEHIEVIAGNGEPGLVDGRGAESSFGSPNAITVGPDDALYINHADGSGATPIHIRRIVHRP